MPAIPNYVIGVPGERAPVTAGYRTIFGSAPADYLPGGRWIDGSKTRDPNNYPDTDRIRAGTLMGKVTANSFYANTIIGQNPASYDGGTTLTIGVRESEEVVRRIGASGTFKLTGPSAAAGTVRTLTITYSSVNTSTGAITVTSPKVNEVQTITFGTAATGGTMILRVPKPDGTTVDTAAITWNATDATWLSNINSALDTATGVSGAWVATGAAPDSALTLTASGTGYAATAFTNLFQVLILPTSVTGYSTVRTTTGVAGAFTAGSIVSQADGSETPITFIPDGYALPISDGTGVLSQLEFPKFPIAGIIKTGQLLGYSTMDSSLKTWVKQQLSTVLKGKYVFDDEF